MEYRVLGQSGLRISEVGFGAWAIGNDGTWEGVSDEESIRALLYTFDHGVNFVDTANLYGMGHSEEIIGRALKQTSEEVYIASKVGFDAKWKEGAIMHPVQQYPQNYTRQAVTEECEGSLKRLGIEAIHLYQLHVPPMSVIRDGEIFGILDDLKRAGKILSYGVSVETCDEALTAMEYTGVTALQIIFNLFRLRPARDVFSIAQEKNVGIIARVPLASGLLSGRITNETQFDTKDHRAWTKPIPGETFSGVDVQTAIRALAELVPFLEEGFDSMAQGALRWILEFDAVTTVIPGIKTVKQARENFAAVDRRSFTRGEMECMEDIYNRYFAAEFNDRY